MTMTRPELVNGCPRRARSDSALWHVPALPVYCRHRLNACVLSSLSKSKGDRHTSFSGLLTVMNRGACPVRVLRLPFRDIGDCPLVVTAAAKSWLRLPLYGLASVSI